MQEAIDRVLAYKNLLAAEDHLHEIDAVTSEEQGFLNGLLSNTYWLRDKVMPEEVDKRYHCLVKHYAAAVEALEEVYKVTREEHDRTNMEMAQLMLKDALEKLWGRSLINCERCGNGRVQRETGDSAAGRIIGRDARDADAATSIHRIVELSPRQISNLSGEETEPSIGEASQGETGSTSEGYGDSAGETSNG